MAITEFLEKDIADKSKKTETGIEYKRVFGIKTNANIIDDATIYNNASCPNIGEAYPYNTSAKCYSTSPVRKSAGYYELTALYRIKQDSFSNSGSLKSRTDKPGVKPWEQPAIIDFGTRVYQKALDKAYQTGDTQGSPSKAVLNTAGEPFDPAPVYESYNLIIRISRNEKASNFNPQNIKKFQNTINVASIQIAGVTGTANQFRINSINGSKDYWSDGEANKTDIAYYKVVYEIEHKEEGHPLSLLNAGYNQLANSGTELEKILDNNDEPVNQPRPLDADGEVLPPSTSESSYVYIEANPHFKADWTTLNLPSSK